MKRKHNIEIDELKSQKIIIKGNKLTLQWVSIPSISENCLLVYSEEKRETILHELYHAKYHLMGMKPSEKEVYFLAKRDYNEIYGDYAK